MDHFLGAICSFLSFACLSQFLTRLLWECTLGFPICISQRNLGCGHLEEKTDKEVIIHTSMLSPLGPELAQVILVPGGLNRCCPQEEGLGDEKPQEGGLMCR